MSNVSSVSIGVKWSVIITMVSIVASIFINLLGLTALGWLSSMAVFVTCVVFAIQDYAKNNGQLSYGQGLASSLFTGLFTGILVGVFVYVFASFAHPEMVEQLGQFKNVQEEQMLQQGFPEEDIEGMLGLIDKLSTPISLGLIAVFFYTFGGFIIGLIASIFLKKDSL